MANLTFRYVTLRNFLSFGNQETTIQLDQDLISVILGENLDTGGEDSRNGAGKSAIIDAICYALFGKTLRGSANQDLINDLVNRGQPLSVKVSFDKGKYSYLVERGEKPSKLLLLRKPVESDEDYYARKDRKLKFDQSMASKTETTKEITKLLGYNLPLFSFLVANSSESTSFFKLREEDRREVSENLFGFTILSERAERLKKIRKTQKQDLVKAETAYATEVQANKRVEQEIAEIERRAEEWETKHAAAVSELEETIQALQGIDAEAEAEALRMIASVSTELKDVQRKLHDLQKDYTALERDRKQRENSIEVLEGELEQKQGELEQLNKSLCPTCGQHWVADPEYREGVEGLVSDTIPERISECHVEIGGIDMALKDIEGEYSDIEGGETNLQEQMEQLSQLDLTYESPEDAASAQATLKMLEEQLVSANAETNPFTESIEGLRQKAVTQVDDSEVRRLTKLVSHFEFMIELLTSKDSFVRRSIIDQWLPKLNERIALYLEILELPHNVTFLPDLSVEIMKFHKKKGWGNLSKGERVRLIIALNFAFQDVFEFMNYRINLLCMDELLDNGLCSRGAERTVDLLKALGSESHKRVLLITHRDDIAARVEHMMIVRKENEISHIVEAE